MPAPRGSTPVKDDPKRRRPPEFCQARIDRVGEQYGDLTVEKLAGWYLKPTGQGEKSISIWSCRCSCGQTSELTNDSILQFRYRQKKNPSQVQKINCGNSPLHFMPCRIGDRSGFLEVVDFPENNGQLNRNYRESKKGGYLRSHEGEEGRWLIACICHNCNQYTRENPFLTTRRGWLSRLKGAKEMGWRSSCGCAGNQSHKMSRSDSLSAEGIAYSLYRSALERSQKNAIPFDLTPEYILQLGIPAVCPVLGIPIRKEGGERTDNSPSIDKFYPDAGYVMGNVQIISWRANRIKNDGTPEEWQKIAEWCQREDVRRRILQVE